MRVRFRHRFAAGAQRTVCRVVLFFLFRALNALSVRDSRVAAEIAPWPESRVLGLEVPGGPALYISRRGRRLARLKTCAAPHILIRFKSVRDAFYVFTGQMGVAAAYAQHRFTVRGNVSETMGFVRCVDLAEGYLFPPFWAKAILKELSEKQLGSLRLYGAVLLGR